MDDRKIIKNVLNNLEHYDISIKYNPCYLKFDDYYAYVGFNALEETYHKNFIIKNVIDLNVLIFPDGREIELTDDENEIISNFLYLKDFINVFIKKIYHISKILNYCEEEYTIEQESEFYKVSDDKILLVSGHRVEYIEISKSGIAFHFYDDSFEEYDFIICTNGFKWFHSCSDEILIFDKSASLV